MKKLQLLRSVLLGIIALIGTGLSAEKYFAKEKALQQLEMRVDQKIISDRAFDLQERIWKFEDRYGSDCSKMPAEVKEEYRKLIEEKKVQEKQLELILEEAVNNK